MQTGRKEKGWIDWKRLQRGRGRKGLAAMRKREGMVRGKEGGEGWKENWEREEELGGREKGRRERGRGR